MDLLDIFFLIAFIITLLIAFYLGLREKNITLPSRIIERPKTPSVIDIPEEPRKEEKSEQ